MRNFIRGVLFTLVVIVIVVAGVILLGMAPTTADVAPPRWEWRIANTALDLSLIHI